ncbi:MAG: cation-translocating P-type ATPase [Flavobacteriaceae bacterium]
MLIGVSEVEAAARQRLDGFNELPRPDRRSSWRIAGEVLREPMLALLMAGGGIYLLLGSLQEALLLLAFAMMSIVITIVQETRTERVLEALQDLTSPRALVIRDGNRRRIPGREVVRGDIMVLVEGDRIPADGRLFESQDLQVDESLLTGESAPVRKSADSRPERNARPGGDDLPFVYSGTLIVRGTGLAETFAIGPSTEIGKIGLSLRSLETEQPHLRKQTGQIVRLSAIAGGLVSLLVLALYGMAHGDWIAALLAAITIGMSMLPEEFPVVLTVFMAMGAWRISRQRVLTRRITAIEAMGSATVLCVDKTGTLTENRMTIAELCPLNDKGPARCELPNEPLSPEARNLALHGLLASASEPFDPMERAFHDFARDHEIDASSILHSTVSPARTYGLSVDLLAVTQVWQTNAKDRGYVVAAKGAPEAIADLCSLGAEERAALRAATDAMASKGLRVLAVASAESREETLPDSPTVFAFRILGVVGLADPLRPDVPAAVRDCRNAGIRVIMITGDYPATARAIAIQAGIHGDGHLLSGEEIAAMDDPELYRSVRTSSIFARVMPEQKLRIVQALKAQGEIVAMTGDGVNDAPSLKAAHIGIAMGGRGTDVAREASSIVLLDDDFGTIVAAIRSGRRIYDNLRKAMGFIFAVHVPIAGLALLPLILGYPIIFSPIHIAVLEMIIDPVCALAFEAEGEESDVMQRPPRPPDEPLFSLSLIGWGLLQGTLVFAIVGGTFLVTSELGQPEGEVRTLTFLALILSITSLIFVNRSFSTSLLVAFRRRNIMLFLILAAVATLLLASLAIPAMRGLFQFGPLHWVAFATAFLAAACVLVFLEAAKSLWRDQFRL